MKHRRANHVSYLRSAHCKQHRSPAPSPVGWNPRKRSDDVTSRIGARPNRGLPHAEVAGRGADQADPAAPDSWGIEVVVRVRGSWL